MNEAHVPKYRTVPCPRCRVNAGQACGIGAALGSHRERRILWAMMKEHGRKGYTQVGWTFRGGDKVWYSVPLDMRR